MPSLHVCPLSRLGETAARIRPSHLVTLVTAGTAVPRPATIPAERHLLLNLSDITQPMAGHILAGEAQVAALLGFVRGWDETAPLLIHCWAGISRSTAAAYAAACALRPEQDEAEIALRLRAAAPSATPNPRVVALADALLGRGGRMERAVAGIGRGAEAFEGTPFALALG